LLEFSNASGGHASLVPLQLSATSHTPAEARHSTLLGKSPHVPFTAAPLATLHAWQSVVTPPPHAVLQQTPSTQKPLGHSLGLVHGSPLPGPASNRYAAPAWFAT
jgi:hypothetical protein